jgi:hypothetical protein
MPNGRDRLPGKTEEQGPLSKVIDLAPLFSLVLQILELILKICGVIN